MAPAGNFHPVEVRLRDGRRVTVREVRADDRDRLQTALRALSAESRYSRFMSAMHELSASMLDRAVARHFFFGEAIELARIADAQGLGGSVRT